MSASAVSANNVIKQLPDLNKRSRVAKLFAKHFKVPEQIEFLKANPCCIATGTPNRLLKLIDTTALSLEGLQLLVVDVHRDLKQRTILDLPETMADFWQLFRDQVQQRAAQGKTKIALLDMDL